jgi:hypothetical protein
LLLAAPTYFLGQADPSAHPANPDQTYLIHRSDDAGMSHSLNTGLEKVIVTAEILPEMSKNRQGELDPLASPPFRDALAARKSSPLDVPPIDRHTGSAINAKIGRISRS